LFSLLLAESANLFLSVRNVLQNYELKENKIFVLTQMMFALTFFANRIGFSNELMRHLQSDPLKPLILNISSVILFWLSYMWILQILNLTVKHFAEANKGIKCLQIFYSSLKMMRKPIPITLYYVWVTWFSTRWFVRARFGVTWY